MSLNDNYFLCSFTLNFSFVPKREKEPFDWYQRYPGVKHFFQQSFLSKIDSPFPNRDTTRVLVPGCGNSKMMEDMIEDGFKNITNIDYSPVVISQMEERCKGKGMVFKVADVTRSLPFPDSSFDLIICKGTFDAILCSPGASVNIRTFMEESSRVLDEKHGILIIISYGNRENRMTYLEDPKIWPGGIEIKEVQKPRISTPNVEEKNDTNHYIYICRKKIQEEEKSEPIIQDIDNQTADSRAKL